MFTYKTKLVAGFVTLFVLSLIVNVVDHLYITKLYQSTHLVEDALNELDFFAHLGLRLQGSTMPANDYLITGDPAEKTKAQELMNVVNTGLETRMKMNMTDEEQALLKEVKTKFDEVMHLSDEIFAIENPVGNKAGGEIMTMMDTLLDETVKTLSGINSICIGKGIRTMEKIRYLQGIEGKAYLTFVFLLIILTAIFSLFTYHFSKVHERQTKQIESAKQEWEKTFDAIKDFITIHDKDFNIIRVNKATAERFNTTQQALIGKKCYEVFHSTPELHPLCPYKKTLETGEPAFVAVDDPYLTSTYPLINEKGEVYATVHIVKDITEMKKAEQRVLDEAIINKTLLLVAKFISSTMDEEAIIQEVVRVTSTLIKCDRCKFFLWLDSDKTFLPKACHGIEASLIPVFKSLRFKEGDFGVLDDVRRQKTSLITKNATNSPLMPPEFAKTFNIVSCMHTPIISRGEVVGVFCTDSSKESHTFSPRDIAIVEGIAAQLGVALENVRLFHETMNRMMELEQSIATIQVMHEIDKNILSTLNSNEILETVALMTHRIIPSDRVTIVLVNREDTCFRYEAGFGIDLPKNAIVPFEDTNATEVLRTGRPISRPNITLEKNLLPLDRQFLEQGFHSDIRVPVKVKEEIIALLNIGSHRVAAFTPEHLSTAEKMAAQLGVALENARLFSDLQELLLNTVKTLVSTIDAKSPWTKGHSERVTELAIIIGKEMGLSQKELDELRFAGLLHDIGKIGTAEYIIDKHGKLTDEEFAIVKEHPLKGAEIIKNIKQFADIIPAIANHHEKVDGTGYPGKLKNGNIHIFGRILALADAYDAMTSDRPYRKCLGREKAIEEIKRCAGTQFDPEVVDAFLRAMGNGIFE